MASIHSDPGQPAGSAPGRPVEIDGVPIGQWVEPATGEEIAAILAAHGTGGKAVTPVGGGTKLALGNAPVRVDTAISMARLNRVLHYEPTDMTLSVEAGIRFEDLQALLAERGQTLPVEIPDAERATIGGLVATGFAGPRRLGSGTLRDLLIGITCAYPSGIVAKAGGLVVKNVTGFDLMRLHLGALGTLGVIVSVNFKVLPLARSEATVVSALQDLDTVIATAKTARSGRLRPIAVEVFQDGNGWRAAVRIEGRSETVGHGLDSLRSGGDWAETSRDAESRDWWRSYVTGQSIAGDANGIVVRFGVEPKRSGELLRGTTELLARHDISPEFVAASPGLGTVMVRFSASSVPAESFAGLQQEMFGIAEAVTVLKAPAMHKRNIDVWGRVPETLSVMRALKSEFDPANVLNPGRFVDRI